MRGALAERHAQRRLIPARATADPVNSGWRPRGDFRGDRALRAFRAASFLVLACLPAAFAALYFSLWAAPQFAAETRFIVTGDVEILPGGDLLTVPGASKLAKLMAIDNSQDNSMIAEYLRSRGLVDHLDAKLDLRRMFSRPKEDFLARLPGGASPEALARFWNQMAKVSIEEASGAVTLQVRAFDPLDAKVLAEAALAETERLVNDAMAKDRQDKLDLAEAEVAKAAAQVKAMLQEEQAFRNANAVIDPSDSAQALIDAITGLRSDRIALDAQLQADALSHVGDKPGNADLRANRAALDQQIAAIEQRITALPKAERGSLSNALSAWQRIEIRRGFADQLYSAAQAALTGANLEAARTHVYVEAYQLPGLAGQAVRFRSAFWILAAAACGLAAWFVVDRLVANVAEHGR